LFNKLSRWFWYIVKLDNHFCWEKKLTILYSNVKVYFKIYYVVSVPSLGQNIWENQIERKKDLFWLMTSLVTWPHHCRPEARLSIMARRAWWSKTLKSSHYGSWEARVGVSRDNTSPSKAWINSLMKLAPSWSDHLFH
jgi:hypothetical protein